MKKKEFDEICMELNKPTPPMTMDQLFSTAFTTPKSRAAFDKALKGYAESMNIPFTVGKKGKVK